MNFNKIFSRTLKYQTNTISVSNVIVFYEAQLKVVVDQSTSNMTQNAQGPT